MSVYSTTADTHLNNLLDTSHFIFNIKHISRAHNVADCLTSEEGVGGTYRGGVPVGGKG